MPEESKYYPDYLRTFAIFLVVLIHTDLNYYYYHDAESGFATFLISVLVTVCKVMTVPMFYMISGSLLLGKEERLSQLFRKRIVRILMVLLVFSLAQYAFTVCRGKATDPSAADFFRQLLQGTIQNTYRFLYLYLTYLIMLPFTRKIASGLSEREWIALALINPAVSVVNFLLTLTGMKACDGFFADLYVAIEPLWYPLMGYAIAHGKLPASFTRNRNSIIALALAVLVPSAGITCAYYGYGNYMDPLLYLFAPVLPCAFFTYVMNGEAYFRRHPGFSRMVSRLSSLTFGIYLTESIVRVILYGEYLALIACIPGVPACCVYAASSFALAAILSFSLKHLPLFRRIL